MGTSRVSAVEDSKRRTEFKRSLIITKDMKKGEKIKVRHILVKPEVDDKDTERAFLLAKAIKDSIDNITDFKKMVKTYSVDKTTKEIGGDLGWITPENYPIPEIGKAIKYIELNSCSPPINTSFGFHLLWMENIKKGGRPDPNKQLASTRKKWH